MSVLLKRELPVGLMRGWRNDRAVRDWCRQDDLISIEEQQRWEESLPQRSDVRMYGVWTGQDKALGVAGLTSIHRSHRTAEFSLYIAPEHQGKGYGRRALEALLDVGFNDLNLATIWGETFVGNPAMHVFKAIGFKTDGTLRQRYFKRGKYLDAYAIAITQREFNGR